MAPSSTLTHSPSEQLLAPKTAKMKAFTTTPLAGFLRKHRHSHNNIQVLSNHDVHPLHVASVEPKATHNITAARKHIFDAVWTTGVWTFADKGLPRACPKITTPLKNDRLNPGDKTIGKIVTSVWTPLRAGTWR
jgi:hypothetical protein